MLNILIGRDRAFGIFLLLIGSVILIYYSAWVIILPFFREDDYLQLTAKLKLFPDQFATKFFGLLLPLSIGTSFFVSVAVYALVKTQFD